ncbi:MAG: translation initiation factor IF-2 [Bacteroidetes bacterium]|nr:MAG: translation initiation factor IF-2 [Bacteroidota bacterium]
MAEKKFYRLFKVAKELNVGTAMLVEHLQEYGHDVANSPNTKLSAEEYDVLLKEFAPDKLIKEKADQLSEKRREEVRSTATPPPVDTPPAREEDQEKDFLSAAELKNRISSPQKVSPPAKEEPTPPVEEKKPEPPVEEPPKEEPKPVETVAKEPETLPQEEEAETGGLKVIGKIDLDKLGGKGRKTPPKKKTADPPAKEEPVAEKKPDAKPVTPPEGKKEVPAEEKMVVPVAEEKPVEIEKPTKEKPVTPEVSEKPQGEEESTESETVIRASDRAPQLAGLKVMGKIELPGDKKKKRNDDKSGAKNRPATTDADADEDDSKKKRRRRKRKRKTTVVTPAVGSGNGPRSDSKDKKGRKERPSAKEVDDSIRETMSQMGKGASRSRQRLRRAKRDADALRREQLEQQMMEDSKVLEVTEFITANEFASLINVPVTEIITKSFQLGVMVSINQRLDAEILSLIAEEYGYEANFVDVTEGDLEIVEEEDAPEDLKSRAPIITVMGHVDHGKTTLLDFLRKTNVTAGEAGGITQHIGAYEVTLKSGRQVTFLDTPGHEAFTAMRARGAKVTDIVIVVISADDQVMPQTKEAINHAQAGNVPMIFAINKIDKPGADPERIKSQLAEMNILVEDWGGDYQSQEISALKGLNVDDLLEKVIVQADLLDLKANPDREATGTVIEARLDRGRGHVATVLVQNGTLRVGDEVVAGIHHGKVRALINQNGERVEEAGPSTPVQLLGLNGQPQAGDRFHVFEEDGRAKDLAQRRSELFREQQLRRTNRLTLEEIGRRRALGNFKELNIIIRGDVDGSVEALAGSLLKLSTDEVQVNIIWKGVGAITEADINLAVASDAIVLAFNVRPNAQARNLAEREEVDIRTYSVIYDAINDVKDALEGLLSPEIKEEIVATAEIKEVFKITKVGNVGGGLVTSGKITRNDSVRVLRDDVVIYDSTFSSLKRFKDDVKEVLNGQEFGFMIENYPDIKAGDTLEIYRVNEIRRKL